MKRLFAILILVTCVLSVEAQTLPDPSRHKAAKRFFLFHSINKRKVNVFIFAFGIGLIAGQQLHEQYGVVIWKKK